jgi:hypothetical protein
MTKLLGELLFEVLRSLIGGWLEQGMFKLGAWLDGRMHGRTIRIVVGVLLGLGAYLLIPIVVGLLGL